MTKPELLIQLGETYAHLELLRQELTSALEHVIEEADAEELGAKKARLSYSVAVSNLQSTANALLRAIQNITQLDETFLT